MYSREIQRRHEASTGLLRVLHIARAFLSGLRHAKLAEEPAAELATEPALLVRFWVHPAAWSGLSKSRNFLGIQN